MTTGRRARSLPALVVPDERSWAMWGHDLAAAGFEAAAFPEEASAVLLPAQIPEALVDGVVEAMVRVPGRLRPLMLAGPLRGRPAQDIVALASRSPSPARGGGDEPDDPGEDSDEEGHGHGHGHGAGGGGEEPWASNMMPIEGTPSPDGLVMDDVEVVLGPLGPPLPGGLLAEVALDGEVVSRCSLTAGLEVPPGSFSAGSVPDPLSPAAWRAAFDQAAALADGRKLSEAARRRHIARVEVERALSHALSARVLGRALGWRQLVDAATHAVHGCMRARTSLSAPRDGPQAIGAARGASERLLALLDDSRRLGSRTRGRGRLTTGQLTGIAGPVARAAGVQVDARLGDPLYEAFGFEPTTLSGGDAQARTILRAAEACDALRLAAAAVGERGGDGDAALPLSGAVEGPRGPVRASLGDGRLRATAPGAARLLEVAGEACVAEPWSRAVVLLVSLDLSPWRMAA